MLDLNINAKFEAFVLPPNAPHENSTMVIPAVRGTPFLRYGKHVYYCYNFKSQKGFAVSIRHLDIMKVGIGRFLDANYRREKHIFKLKYLVQKYHYGMSLLEQLFLINTPHTVTSIGKGRFIIGLWAYYGYLLVDCREKTVTYRVLEGDDNHVLGSHQWFDPKTDELYYMTFSLPDSLKRCIDPYNEVFCRVLKEDMNTGKTTLIWEGEHVDYLHDIEVNETRKYCVIPEFGFFLDGNNNLIPSTALVVDLKTKKHWKIPDLVTGAHIKFDPEDPDIAYFSNHNFKIVHKPMITYIIKGKYFVDFCGPGYISKYRLTDEGPQKMGEFTHPELFRVFDHKIFFHRGRKIIAVIGFPNTIFLADADDLTFIKKIEVTNERSVKHLYRKIPCSVGTITHSFDGEKLYVQTRYSFQIIDIETGKPECIKNYFFSHTCTNHMINCTDTDW